jgi:hypothetical protein
VSEQKEPPTVPAAAPARHRPSPAALIIAAGLVLAVFIVGDVLVPAILDARGDRGAQGPAAVVDATGTPRTLTSDTLASNESYVEARVLEDGDVVVRQWIRAAEPFDRLGLALPDVPGVVGLSASGVVVLADDTAVEGPESITAQNATYTFDATTDVQVSYRLIGAVEMSSSARGRALAAATTLDVLYSPRVDRETRVVRAPQVLSVACSPSPQVALVPCGQEDGTGQWRIELSGPHVLDRVAAQLSLE